jgi:hypothetical protein
MQPLQFAVPLDALEGVADLLPYVILVLVLANAVTRGLAHRKHAKQVENGAESLSRFYPHWAVSVLLLLVSFAFLVVEQHGGFVMSVLVISVFVSDFFEFEARNVEARNGMSLERPKGALTAWGLLLLYALFQSVFFVIAPVWNAII